MTQDILIGYTWAWGGALMIDSPFDLTIDSIDLNGLLSQCIP